MKVIPFIYNDIDDLMANTYLFSDGMNCVVIDPSKDYEGIVNYISKNNLKLKGVLLTHGHYDHMRGVKNLLKYTDIPLFIGFYDVDNLKDSQKNLSNLFSNENIIIDKEPISVYDKQEIALLKEPIIVLETPFHTRGSVCYYLKDSKILFSGDTLFKYSIGRDDLYGACPKERKTTLAKLMSLHDDVKIYPGHGEFSSIGEERKYNPFVK